MDVIDTICDKRLALTDILTERRQHLLNVLRNVELVNLNDLDNILQQYCSLRRNIIVVGDIAVSSNPPIFKKLLFSEPQQNQKS